MAGFLLALGKSKNRNYVYRLDHNGRNYACELACQQHPEK
jgi:hypothetical protein